MEQQYIISYFVISTQLNHESGNTHQIKFYSAALRHKIRR